MNPRVQNPKLRIETWLESIPSSDLDNEEPRAKRARRDAPDSAGDTFAYQYNMSPPLTDRSIASEQGAQDALHTPMKGRKRPVGEADRQMVLDEREAARLQTTAADADHHLSEPEGTPRPRKRQLPYSRRSKKTRATLDQLQKPFRVHPLSYAERRDKLPQDILPLYEQVVALGYRQGIIPHEVRDEIVRLDMVPNIPGLFRQPNPAARGEAMEVLLGLRRILRRAAASLTYTRSDSAWNNLVHTPLLDIAFSGDVLGIDDGLNDPTSVHVRFEPVMSASIVGDSIPFISGSDGHPSEPACSYSPDSQLCSSEPSNPGSNLIVGMIRSSDAKVDYVLAMDSPDSRLRKVIFELINRDQHPLPHVNQTAYVPLKESPIAVAIEAKIQSPVDPLVQLGVWTAAWYQRMYDLREARVGAGPKPRLVSVPIIQVISHQWHIYFCCDAGTSIEVYGPVSLGSTEDLVSTYILLSCLEALKSWITDTFRKSIGEWFLCDDDEEGNDAQGPDI